jgi:beta-phosphoglucomutase
MAGKKRATRLKAVLFDLDGVVTDTAGLHAAAWRRMAHEIGWRFDEDLLDALRGVPRLEALALIAQRNGLALSAGESDRLAARKNEYYVESLSGIGPADILPGVLDLLDSLQAEGLRAALASASRNARAIVERLGISARFDALADPAGLPGKPDPAIFLECARLLGVAPESCLGIEDAQVGIEAIRSAGMAAVAVGRNLEGADAWVAGTGELSISFLESAFRKASLRKAGGS